jgi:hypothetical protein
VKPGTNWPARAAALVMGGTALFGLPDNFTRLTAETGGLWQFHFLRAGIALLLLWPLACALGAGLRNDRAPG